jgi:hypothetical protein
MKNLLLITYRDVISGDVTVMYYGVTEYPILIR